MQNDKDKPLNSGLCYNNRDMSFLYLVSLIVLLAIYVLMLFLFKYFKNTLITNIIFASIIFICHIIHAIIVYNDVGPNDWNFLNMLPTANVSPFMFTVVPLFFVLPKSIRKYFALLISLLSVGMIISPTVSSVHFFLIGYKFHPSFLLDYLIQ